MFDSHGWPSSQAALPDQFLVTSPLLYHRFTTIHSTAQTGLRTIIKFKIPVTSFINTLNKKFPHDYALKENDILSSYSSNRFK